MSVNVHLEMTRRALLGRTSAGIGSAALASLLAPQAFGAPALAKPQAGLSSSTTAVGGLLGLPHFPARAKRVIYLFQSGGPSQMDLFDPKPNLAAMFDRDLP